MQIGRVALRYAPTCNAVWARTTSSVTHNEIYAFLGTGTSYLESGSASASISSVLSPMYDASQTLEATGSVLKNNGNGFGASTSLTYPIRAGGPLSVKLE